MTGFPRRLLPAVAALLLLGSLPPAVRAQHGWTADLSVGRAAYDAVSSSVGTNHLSLGLRYGGSPGWLYLAGGAPFASGGARWGAGGLGGRLGAARGDVSLGMDVAAHLFGYADADSTLSGSGVTIEAVPLLTLRRGPIELELRSGAVHYRVHGDTSLARTAHDSGLRLSMAGNSFTLVSEGRYLRVPEGGFPYAGAAAQWVRGRATLWAFGGQWLSEDIPAASAGGGVSLRLDDRTDVHAGWQQEPNDPLYWNATRRTWNLRLSRSLGPARPPAPVFPRARSGRITIRIPLDASRAAPFIMGDFTGWEPVAMSRSGEYWAVSLPITPGTYYYGFKRADGEWFVPSSVPHQVDDGMGGTTAVLIVS